MIQYTFVYIPLTTIPPSEIHSFLCLNEESLKRRGLTVAIKSNPSRIEGTRQEKEESGSCHINAYMDDRLLEGMQTSSVHILYDNAKLPRNSKPTINEDGELFCNGESHRLFYPTAGVFIESTVTCLPSRRTVQISLDVGDKYDKDLYRRAILDVQWKVERTLKRTRAATQLIQAFRTTPLNEGFIERSIKELYVAIGQF